MIYHYKKNIVILITIKLPDYARFYVLYEFPFNVFFNLVCYIDMNVR